MTQLTPKATPALDQSEPQSEYSIWQDPHFWAFCELLADECTKAERAPEITDGRPAAAERGKKEAG